MTRPTRQITGAGRGLALVVLLTCGLGCRPGDGGDETAANFRFIDRESTEIFDPGSLIAADDVTVWSFGVADRLEWTIEPSPQPPGPEADLSFQGAQRHAVTLTRAVTLDASAIDAVAVDTLGAVSGRIAVAWHRAGEPFAPTQRIEVGLAPQGSAGITTTRVSLAAHPQWHGAIAALRLELNLYPRLSVRAVRAVRESLDPERLAAALAQPWKVDLGDEVRNARLSVPGIPITRRLEVVPGAIFRFGYGLQPGVERQVTFRVSLRRAGGAEPVELFADRLAPAVDGSWHEATVELLNWAGETVDLMLETAVDDDRRLEAQRGLPVWSNPEVATLGRSLPPNVVLISLDTLRADHLSLYGYEKVTSPHLDAWAAAHATVFEQVVAAAPWTLPAHVSMFSGLDAHRHGVNYASPAPATMTFLAEILRAAGYATAAVTGGGFVHPRWGFAQGFDRYAYFSRGNRLEEELRTNVDRALALLAEPRTRPLFLFFHSYAVHNPYRAHQPYFDRLSDLPEEGWEIRLDTVPSQAADGWRRRHSPTLLRQGEVVQKDGIPAELAGLPADLYDSGIAYLDEQLARLLSAPALAAPTLVIVTSDHGEMLGEHGLMSHLFLYDENLMVPLLVADASRRGAGRRVSTQVRSVDLLPTILELVDLEVPSQLDGSSLVPLLEGRPTSLPDAAISYAGGSNRGVALRLENGLKYIFDNSVWSTQDKEELYDLRADPGELDDRSRSAPELAQLRQRVARILEKESSGVRLRFANAGDHPLQGTLNGPVVSAFHLKRSVVGCDCFTFVTEGQARFRVPPGERFTIRSESTRGGPLAIAFAGGEEAGAGAGAQAARLVVEVTALDVPRHLALVDGRWQQRDGDAVDVATGVSVWWQGDRQVEEEAPTQTDQALREQLKALGYLQ